MRIYAVRDRLIDYYMQPFVGPDDKNVQAALARTVNQQEGTLSDIAQAPHHFELWELGEVKEDGHITPTRRLVCDCASLIRPGIRARREPEGAGAAEAAGALPEERRGNGPPGRAPGGAIPRQAPPEESPTAEVRRDTQGGYPPRNGQ